jgi:Transposase, Mutator family
VITRPTKQWQAERDAFMRRDLSGVDYVYCWVDGIHFNIRLEGERLCCLVVVGVRADGTKELVAIGDGYRGVDRVLGRSAAGPAPPRHARPGPRRRRRRAGVLGGAVRRVARDSHPAVPGAQGGH